MDQDKTGKRGFLPEPYSKEYAYQWLEKCPYDSIVHLVICLNALNEGKEPPEEHVIFLSPFLRKMLAEKWYESTIERQLKIYFPEVFEASKQEEQKELQGEETANIESYEEDKSSVEEEFEQVDLTAEDIEPKVTQEELVIEKSTQEEMLETKESAQSETEDEEGCEDVERETAEDSRSFETTEEQRAREATQTEQDPFAQERTFLEWIEFLLSRHPVKENTEEKQKQEPEDQISQIKQMLDQLSPKKQTPKTQKTVIVSERLAQIYEQQGEWKEALEIYKALTLQKPEKKDYFEKKIEELKRKIRE
ncbi:MAG: hypothetical protein GXO48_00420 [Chlorobi bacterium]|nr:hypothetical protein [Chlorobiota bacterium]